MASTEDKSKRRSSIFDKISNALKGPQTKTPDTTEKKSTPTTASTTTAATASTPVTAKATEQKEAPKDDLLNPKAEGLGKSYDVKGKTALITGAGSGTLV